jgi:hypothetical protein
MKNEPKGEKEIIRLSTADRDRKQPKKEKPRRTQEGERRNAARTRQRIHKVVCLSNSLFQKRFESLCDDGEKKSRTQKPQKQTKRNQRKEKGELRTRKDTVIPEIRRKQRGNARKPIHDGIVMR